MSLRIKYKKKSMYNKTHKNNKTHKTNTKIGGSFSIKKRNAIEKKPSINTRRKIRDKNSKNSRSIGSMYRRVTDVQIDVNLDDVHVIVPAEFRVELIPVTINLNQPQNENQTYFLESLLEISAEQLKYIVLDASTTQRDGTYLEKNKRLYRLVFSLEQKIIDSKNDLLIYNIAKELIRLFRFKSPKLPQSERESEREILAQDFGDLLGVFEEKFKLKCLNKNLEPDEQHADFIFRNAFTIQTSFETVENRQYILEYDARLESLKQFLGNPENIEQSLIQILTIPNPADIPQNILDFLFNPAKYELLLIIILNNPANIQSFLNSFLSNPLHIDLVLGILSNPENKQEILIAINRPELTPENIEDFLRANFHLELTKQILITILTNLENIEPLLNSLLSNPANIEPLLNSLLGNPEPANIKQSLIAFLRNPVNAEIAGDFLKKILLNPRNEEVEGIKFTPQNIDAFKKHPDNREYNETYKREYNARLQRLTGEFNDWNTMFCKSAYNENGVHMVDVKNIFGIMRQDYYDVIAGNEDVDEIDESVVVYAIESARAALQTAVVDAQASADAIYKQAVAAFETGFACAFASAGEVEVNQNAQRLVAESLVVLQTALAGASEERKEVALSLVADGERQAREREQVSSETKFEAFNKVKILDTLKKMFYIYSQYLTDLPTKNDEICRLINNINTILRDYRYDKRIVTVDSDRRILTFNAPGLGTFYE